MASSPAATSAVLAVVLVATLAAGANAATFTITNQCSFTVWPAATPVGGGAQLEPGRTWAIDVPAGTSSGRVWGRTGCSFDAAADDRGVHARRRQGLLQPVGDRRVQRRRELLLQLRRDAHLPGEELPRRVPVPRRQLQAALLQRQQQLPSRLLPLVVMTTMTYSF
uniref:Thaumatin-like protein n=1 Tax=Oryza brachyantha TaxID=4533 RepID=J3NF75_ORYBR